MLSIEIVLIAVYCLLNLISVYFTVTVGYRQDLVPPSLNGTCFVNIDVSAERSDNTLTGSQQRPNYNTVCLCSSAEKVYFRMRGLAGYAYFFSGLLRKPVNAIALCFLK